MMNEGGGRTAYDVSGNQIHATFNNLVTWSNGQFGTAVTLDGTNALMQLAATLTLSGNVTYSAWVKPTGTQDYRHVIGPGTNDWGIFLTPANIVYGTLGGADTVTGVATVPQNAWTHIALTWDGTTSTLYQNGRPDGTSATLSRFNIRTFGGDQIGTGTETWEGAMDDIRVYARCLGAGEIQSLYLDPFLEFRPVLSARRVKSLLSIPVLMATYRQRRI